ncbi:small ubiquitin-related modifier 2-like [Convolutriloba macropyga]|uniref:small ubiquitin-related modifier 2-like n=1 Tax=Convolutriloba macropyga TaxID=536237 RepID=UPI003F524AD1
MSEREQEDIKPFLNGPTAKEQRGSAAGDKENSTHSHIEVTLEFEGDHMKFKVKESTKVNKIKSTFCERRNLKADSLRCHNEDGERLEDNDTVGKCGLTDGAMIILLRNQTGGAQGRTCCSHWSKVYLISWKS